ncbi:MAG: hypothetical protein KAY46_01800 [Burkholderiaceae bacterium]|nr:hypothetical protein [Burkholderiaceae bacterium]
MYIVAIAWLYVLLLISIMQPTAFRGIVTFIGAGLLPLGLLLYLVGTPRRRRDQALREEPPDAQDAPANGAAGESPAPAGPSTGDATATSTSPP